MANATKGSAKPAAKPQAKPASEKKPNLLPAIYVRSIPEVFRRAGHVFTREGHGLLIESLTSEQLKAIRQEPMLSVQECEIPATAEDDALLQAGGEPNADSSGGAVSGTMTVNVSGPGAGSEAGGAA